jgi:peptidoglycan hydrolase-like protein with peptidoglycan-binding domain
VSGKLRVGLIGVVLAGAAAFAVWWAGAEATEVGIATSETTSSASDLVTRKTLSQSEEFAGSLGYGEQFSLPGQALGTVTWVPSKGTAIHPGETLYKIDDRPTYWAQGPIPTYRPLASGSKGNDVEQLQRYLQAEGYLSEDFEVDGKYGTDTRNAVKEWQDDHDLEKTGWIDSSQLLFLPYDALRIATVPRIGEAAQGGVLNVSLPKLFVSVDVSARKKSVFEGRPTVDVELADGSHYTATVESIAAQQAQDAFGEQRYRVRLELDAPIDQEPGEVTVAVIDLLAENVLAVPVRSLVALVEGGYAVEVIRSDGSTEYRAVEIGEFADGWVEITGDISEGDEVVVPQ